MSETSTYYTSAFYRICGLCFLLVTAYLPSPVRGTRLILSESDTSPALSNPTIDLGVGESGSLYVWLLPEEGTINGPGLSLRATNPNVVSILDHEVFNPFNSSLGVTRWNAIGAGITNSGNLLVSNSNAVSVIGAAGLDPALHVSLGDPLTTELGGTMAYLHSRLDIQAHSSGATDLFLQVGQALITIEGSGPTNSLRFGAGDVQLVSGAVAAATDNIADGIIRVSDRSVELNGGGDTYFQDFDTMGTGVVMPIGWHGAETNRLDSLGLSGRVFNPDLGFVNVGGNVERFSSSDSAQRIATWKDDVDGNGVLDSSDVITDAAADRALGTFRAGEADTGKLSFAMDVAEHPLRAFVLEWDLEIWGGQPDSTMRGGDGAGFHTELLVANSTYYSDTASLLPGVLFDTLADGAPLGTRNSSLINGNNHVIRGISSGIREVDDLDGAVGNTVSLTFDANFGNNDEGWISAIDNVRLRALAPGDVDANGVVDVQDLLTLLAGQKFNKGADDVTWEQGDFNSDDQFNTGDLLAMLSFLSGTFPSDPYASEAGAASDAVADVIVNSETGEVTVDLAGHTVSAVIIESASETFNGSQPDWDTTSQFPSTLPGELGNVLFTSTASGIDELGVVISAEFLGRDKEFYLQDLDLNILIASEGGALTKGNVIVVPEPSTWVLLGIGSLAFIVVSRYRSAVK